MMSPRARVATVFVHELPASFPSFSILRLPSCIRNLCFDEFGSMPPEGADLFRMVTFRNMTTKLSGRFTVGFRECGEEQVEVRTPALLRSSVNGLMRMPMKGGKEFRASL